MLHSYEKYVGRLQGEYLEAFKKIEMYFKPPIYTPYPIYPYPPYPYPPILPI